ncbi:hypothetical protein ZWY2020_000099 [Hordeum vulgare]|nr:hypothetical protein ZWY2020_000099 [Hordeum vulgare]
MSRRKRLRSSSICAPTLKALEATTTLPTDLLLEIMARTDLVTVVRGAAVCKHLRRDILCPSFIRRITQQAAPSIRDLLCTYVDTPALTLVYPATPCLGHNHLSPPSLLRNADKDVLGPYYPVASRGGLVVLNMNTWPNKSKGSFEFDLAVYDPMVDHCTFLSKPPDESETESSICNEHKYVLLTAADGIDCSFMLLSIVFNRSSMKVCTSTSSSPTWGPITCVTHHDFTWWLINGYKDPAVLRGGVIHWLRYTGDQIVTYNVRTGMPGLVKLPPTKRNARYSHLATSPNGNMLQLLDVDGFKISVWQRLPTGEECGGSGWALQTVIDVEEKLLFSYPNSHVGVDPDALAEFKGFGNRSGDIVLMEARYEKGYLVFDLKRREMNTQKHRSTLLELDLLSRLQNMRLFS